MKALIDSVKFKNSWESKFGTLYSHEVKWYDVILIFLFLVGAFAPKAIQKIAENKLLEK